MIACDGYLLYVLLAWWNRMKVLFPTLINLKLLVFNFADRILVLFWQNGFVNSLAFAQSGRFLLAGTGQVCQRS